jgi:tetratricopeptide (TPR) repeat protein
MVFFLLGLMTKESAVVLPALLLLFDFFFISKGLQGLRRRLKYHVPHLLTMCIAAVAYVSLIFTPVLDTERSWTTHILTELNVFVTYLKLLILPIGLNIDHDVLPSTTFDGHVLLSVLVLSALLCAAIVARKKQMLISFSIFWFFINMAVFLVIRLNDYMAERWVYLASMGFCIGLAEILMLLAGRHRRTGIALIVAFLLVNGTLTVMRNQVYTRPVLLWGDAARQSPEKYRPLLNLSSAYMENGNTTLGAAYAREAITQWKKRGARSKDIVTAYLNIAAAYGNDTTMGEDVLKSVEQSASQNVDFFGTGGALALNAGKYDEALTAFKKALELSPQSAAFLYLTGECYENLGQKKTAEEYFVRATAATPQSAQEYMGQGEAFSRLGDYRKASEAFHAALKADPMDVSMRVYFATIMLKNGYLDQAVEHFSLALKLSPAYAPAYKGMGQVMLEKGRNAEAIGYFDRALEFLSPESPERKSVLDLRDKAKQGLRGTG